MIVQYYSILRKIIYFFLQICHPSGKTYTNREIVTLSIRVAQHFEKLQIQQGEIIGFCGSNTEYVAPLVIGTFLAGLTLSTLDPSFDKDGIKHIYSITKPKIMFCDGSILPKMKEALKEINLNCDIYTMSDHVSGSREITEFLQSSSNEENYRLI